jgi:hypothetical protein
MSDEQRDAIKSALAWASQAWQFGAALVALTLAWAAMSADIRAVDVKIDANVALGQQRRMDLERRVDERDARHEARIGVVESRATSAEIALAGIRADLTTVKTGIEELLRDARANRAR